VDWDEFLLQHEATTYEWYPFPPPSPPPFAYTQQVTVGRPGVTGSFTPLLSFVIPPTPTPQCMAQANGPGRK
jgi:hypothetical protein